MAGELTKTEQDLPEINWKFIKNQEWGWDCNERPEEEKVSWAGLERRRKEPAAPSTLTPVLLSQFPPAPSSAWGALKLLHQLLL